MPADADSGSSRTRRGPQAWLTGLLAAALVVAMSGTAQASTVSRSGHKSRRPVIHIAAGRLGPRVHQTVLGVNSRWARNGEGVWDPASSAPVPRAIELARRAGIRTLRYPGGTDATMFNWKHAVGKNRGCQMDGHWSPGGGFFPAADATAYGPSEYMQVVHALGAQPLIMAPFVRQTPRDAADWVEYMNSPVGANPNGGADWAKVRAADGHPAPYHVRRWEVGNEAHVAPRRYLFSHKMYWSLREYAFGGERQIKDEKLGKGCKHPARGVPSNGAPRQKYSLLYPPVKPGSISLSVGRKHWRRVFHLKQSGPDAHVYTLNADTGEVTFGNGTHGAIPHRGMIVHAAYRNTYAGYFKFARAMKAVDPHIDVCATWGKPAFPRLVGNRHFDCLTSHPITNFNKHNHSNWRNAVEGHDRMMTGIGDRRRQLATLRRSLPAKTPLWLTEFNTINGDGSAFHRWSTSDSHAVYMAAMDLLLLKQGLPWGNGGDFITHGTGAVLSNAPNFTFSAEAVQRETLLPVFEAGGRVAQTSVSRNPQRVPAWRHARSYGALDVAATRSHGAVWLVVLNLLPSSAVRARIDVGSFRHTGTASVRRMTSKHFTDWNAPGRAHAVRLHTGTRSVGHADFMAAFPAHSITVFRLTSR